MISFENDYSEGASEKILQRLIETNMEQLSGYGNDRYCESAKEKIRKASHLMFQRNEKAYRDLENR